MTKEKYKQILHTTKIADKLDGILRVAIHDTEISPEDFDELVDEKNAILMEKRR